MTDREKLIELMEQAYFCSLENLADHLISNGVVVRERGEWDDSYDGITPYCTVCRRSHRGMNRTPNFCPHCGSDMRGGKA